MCSLATCSNQGRRTGQATARTLSAARGSYYTGTTALCRLSVQLVAFISGTACSLGTGDRVLLPTYPNVCLESPQLGAQATATRRVNTQGMVLSKHVQIESFAYVRLAHGDLRLNVPSMVPVHYKYFPRNSVRHGQAWHPHNPLKRCAFDTGSHLPPPTRCSLCTSPLATRIHVLKGMLQSFYAYGIDGLGIFPWRLAT